MALSITHNLVSAVADAGVSGEVGPDEWNANHTITAAAGKVLGRDTSGNGAVQELPIQVDTGGNVGINGAPVNNGAAFGTLTLQGSTGGALEYKSNGTSIAQIYSSTGGQVFNAYTGYPLLFQYAGTEVLRLDSTKNVGIGNVSPLNKLDLTGSFGRGAPVTKTGDFTLGATENWVVCNKSSSLTITFPAASSWTGREVMIKTITAQTVVSASSNVVPIGSTTAGTAILAATAGKWATLVSDGTNWVIMAAG